MNIDLKCFEKIYKIEIIYPNKGSFIFYNDILPDIKIKLNDTEFNLISLKLRTKCSKQIKFESDVFFWLEEKGYIKNFSNECINSIIPSEDYCLKKNIKLIRIYG